jgi:adsorption protein B
MVQLPVEPLSDPRSRWVAGHYLDEFAETHTRDMMVRSRLGAPLPSAGVGTAIGRDWLARLAGPDGAPFDARSLTEDYELGHRLHALGGRGVMVRARVEGELVATRAYFPATLEAAVRQKARWLMGIALDGWDRLGWPGGLVARWMLLRDRKGLLTAAVAIIAYATALLFLAQLAARAILEQQAGVTMPPLLGPDATLLTQLLWINAGLLGWRLLARAGFTGAQHGAVEALRAIPRAVLANGINFLAGLRAFDRYRGALTGGTAPAWDKTAHRFPPDAVAAEPARG